MNFFGRKNTPFDAENDFYDAPMQSASGLEEVSETPAPEAAPKAQSANPFGIGGNSIQLKVFRPERYDEVGDIAEKLLEHCTVVLNLELVNKDVCMRMLDFLSGVAFAIGGQIRRINATTYIVTPSNVDISDSEVIPTDTDV